MKPKILLLRPPIFIFKGCNPAALELPLGLLYIGGMLETNGYEVKIFDALLYPDESKLPSKDFQDQYFGASWTSIKRFIEDYKPEIVGITNQFFSQLPALYEVTKIIKNIDSNILTVCGGPHPSASPESLLRDLKELDIVVRMEGEETVLEIVKWYQSKLRLEDIKGISYRNNGTIINTPSREPVEDIDTLSLPAYHLVDIERYFELKKMGFDGREIFYSYPGVERAVSLITSRGCPYNCCFCSIHLTMGRKWRSNSVDYVINHLKLLISRYNVNHIHFEDDNLTLDPERFNLLLNRMIKQKIKITWDIQNGVRADLVNEALLIRCKETGCTCLRIAVESGNPRVLREIIDKKLDIEKVIKVAEISKRIGLYLEAFYIIGFPGETLSEMEETIEFACTLEKRYGTKPHLFTATPLIGTRLYDICHKKGYIVKEMTPRNIALATSGEGMIETEYFGLADIVSLRKLFHKKRSEG